MAQIVVYACLETEWKMVKNEKGGVALVLVIWIMVVLIAIAGEFSHSMRTEISITRNFKEEEEAYQLALAGIEQAKLEILSINAVVVYLNENNVLVFGKDMVFEEDMEEPLRSERLGSGEFSYVITDEEGKININTATIDQLKYFFLETGIDSTEVDTIVDSMMDWRDTNDLHMLNGAEEDYYQSLEKPYSSKDGPFQSVEELLLVKGMTKKYFNGSKDGADENDEETYKGVKNQFTVYGSGRININTASGIALRTLFGDINANAIISLRETGPITSPQFNGKVSSEFFSIISTGAIGDGTIKRSIKTVVQKKNNVLETLYWNDNIIG